MVYSGIQTFMEKLKQLIMNENHIPFINHPEIIRQRPQFQRLYDELHNPIIQTLFIDQHQDLEKVKDLKKRFIDAAEEAQYIVDLFLSAVHTVYNNDFNRPLMDVMRSFHSVKVELMNMKMDSPERTVNQHLEKVMRSLESIKVELMSMTIDNMKMDSSQRKLNRHQHLEKVMRSLESVKVELMTMIIDNMKMDSSQRTLNQHQHLEKVMRSLESVKVELMTMTIDNMKMDSSQRTLNQHQHLEKVNDLKKRFIDAAEEAQYIVDLFLSSINVGDNELFTTSEDFKRSLNIDDVMRSFESVKVELMSIQIDNMKMASSPRPERMLNQPSAAPISSIRTSQGSKKLMEENVVGLHDDFELIRDKLLEDQRKLDVVSIVGMGGIGKTTLATKVFNDRFVMYHFYVRVWVTVSQTYDKRDVLIQILESIRGQLHLQKDISESELREMVHKNLMCKRYLIVIDDIWHTQTWDNLKVFFPRDNNGSRILVTTRLMEVAKHANSDGLIHQLGYLRKEQSWDLLCQKVFSGNECPEWSIKPGMQIVENCHGLPLAVLVIAGVLAKEVLSEKFWVEIAERTGSYIVGDQNGCLETLALSYNHLPLHLRECFLYLGGFPEDYRFRVQRLIWLWMAEGFIQEDGNRSSEDIAEGYLMDLIDRNLVIIVDRQECNGPVEACKLHDIVRELCLKKAKEEQFILQTERMIMSFQSSNAITPQYKPVRMFLNEAINHQRFDHTHSKKLRSFLGFGYFEFLSDDIAKHFHSFVLLRVFDLGSWLLNDFPEHMELLVHLRYLAISTSSKHFPSSICNLWNLQTLIYNIPPKSGFGEIVLPGNISDLVNLRHLHGSCSDMPFVLPYIKKPLNLQTISCVVLKKFQKDFPYIKELTCSTNGDGNEEYNFKSLTCLEELAFFGNVKSFTFPATLKTLTLQRCRLQWSDMSIIQSLPNLQVLKLHQSAFDGSYWNTDEQEFPQLKFLRLDCLDIEQWEAYSTSFPCLRQLEILYCYLEEIPLEIGDIPTLELINIKGCRPYLGESVKRIQEKQNDLGNYDLKIIISKERTW